MTKLVVALIIAVAGWGLSRAFAGLADTRGHPAVSGAAAAMLGRLARMAASRSRR